MDTVPHLRLLTLLPWVILLQRRPALNLGIYCFPSTPYFNSDTPEVNIKVRMLERHQLGSCYFGKHRPTPAVVGTVNTSNLERAAKEIIHMYVLFADITCLYNSAAFRNVLRHVFKHAPKNNSWAQQRAFILLLTTAVTCLQGAPVVWYFVCCGAPCFRWIPHIYKLDSLQPETGRVAQ